MRHFLWVLASCVLVMPAGLCAGEKNPVVVMETSMGSMEVELYADKAPETVKNFLGYVSDKFYDGTIFHRVINGFMIQGGGFGADLKQKSTKDPIKNEADNGLKNETGTLAMARTGSPHSATAQFFINVKDNVMLDYTGKTDRGWGYCVFGKVAKGMDVVDKIKAVKTSVSKGTMRGQEVPMQDVPVEAVVIKSVKVNL